MSSPLPPLPFEHWSQPIEDIDVEIVQLASVCGVHIHEAHVIERLMRADPLVSNHDNPRALTKLSQLLKMHYLVTERAVEALGADEATVMAQAIAQRLRQRFGPKLGGEAAEALDNG